MIVIRSLKGDVDPDAVKKGLHRVLSLFLWLIWAAAVPRLVQGLDAHRVFFGAYLLLGSGIGAGVVLLWWKYRAVLSVWEKTPVLLACLGVPWLWLGFYEIVLRRSPLDLMTFFYAATLLFQFMTALAIPRVNLSKAVSFLTVAWVCLTALDMMSYPRSESWVRFYQFPKNSFDVVFIGNSHALHTFRPDVIDSTTGLNTYSLGIPGSSIDATYYEIKELLDYQQPRLIVIESSSMGLDFQESLLRSSYNLHLGPVFWDELFTEYAPDEYITAFSPAVRTHVQWTEGVPKMVGRLVLNLGFALDSDTLLNLPQLASIRYKFHRGFMELPNIMADVPRLERPAELDTMSQNSKEYLDRIIKLCHEHHITLWIVEAPQFALAPDPENNPVAQWVESKSLMYTQYDDTLSRIHFQDRDHLNSFGSTTISLHTAQWIADFFDRPLNETVYRQYRAILVSDLRTDVQGDQITYTLNRVEDHSPDAEFKWWVTDAGGGVLADVPYSDQNSVTFTLPAGGNYTLKIEVRSRSNPAIHSQGVLTVSR